MGEGGGEGRPWKWTRYICEGRFFWAWYWMTPRTVSNGSHTDKLYSHLLYCTVYTVIIQFLDGQPLWTFHILFTKCFFQMKSLIVRWFIHAPSGVHIVQILLSMCVQPENFYLGSEHRDVILEENHALLLSSWLTLHPPPPSPMPIGIPSLPLS